MEHGARGMGYGLWMKTLENRATSEGGTISVERKTYSAGGKTMPARGVVIPTWGETIRENAN